MFGYVRPYKPELKIKDFAVYKAVYCGLCRTLGKRYGFLARMILSYDATLFCIMDMSLKNGCKGFEKCRCPAKPYKKCDASKPSPELDFWADVSIILGYYKVRDNLSDKGLKKRAAALFILPFASYFYRKAAARNPFITQNAGEYIKKQTEVENKHCPVIDEAAEPTAKLMSNLLKSRAGSDAQSRVLERLGYFMGRWIYLADAVDDLGDDIKSGGYNPIAACFGLTPGTSQIEGIKNAEFLLNSCLYEIAAAYNLLDKYCFVPILENVFFLGLPEVKKAVLSGLGGKEKKKRFPGVYGI